MFAYHILDLMQHTSSFFIIYPPWYAYAAIYSAAYYLIWAFNEYNNEQQLRRYRVATMDDDANTWFWWRHTTTMAACSNLFSWIWRRMRRAVEALAAGEESNVASRWYITINSNDDNNGRWWQHNEKTLMEDNDNKDGWCWLGGQQWQRFCTTSTTTPN